ncbi:MAG: restriction endonuclease subunit S [Saprospiraceae bacterium]|nr:restriction endonuclease subunit S [Saprospiraceae bacterium]
MVEGFKHTEIGTIPIDWEVKTLGEVGEVRMCRRVFNHETKEQGEIPFFKIGTFGKEPDAYISKKLYDNYRQRFSFPKKGDILISAAGTIGRTLIYDGSPSYYQDSNIVWIENNETLIPNEFLFHILQVVKYSTEGGTIQRLYNSILRNTKFTCPPTKAEQTAIATALNDADALIQKLEQLIAKKRNIKTGAMQELLTGKKRLNGFTDDWISEPLLNLCWFQEGPGLRNWQFTKFGIKVINVTNLENGFLNLDRTDRYISLEEFNRMYKHFEIDEDDIVVASSGNSYGKVAVVRKRDLPLLMNTSVIRFKPLKNLDYNFLHEFLKSKYFKEQIDLLITGGAQPNFGPAHLKKIIVKLPKTKTEQNAIAQILSDMDNEIQELEMQLEKYKMMKQGMMQVLLTGKIRLNYDS